MQRLTKHTIRIFWNHTKQYRLQIFLIGLGLSAVLISDIAQPFFYRALLNFVAGEDRSNLVYPFKIILGVSAMAILYNIGWRGVVAATNILEGKTKRDLYRAGYNYLMNHSLSFFGNNFVGGLVSKLGRYDRAYETLADEVIFGAGRTAVLMVFIFITLAYQIPLAAFILAIWMAIFLVISFNLNKLRFKHDLNTAAQDTIATGHVADTIANANTVKVFAAEYKEKNTFDNITEKQYFLRKKTWDISNGIDAFHGSMMLLLEFVLMYAALRLWQVGNITVGDFVLLQSFMLNVFHHLWNVGKNLRHLYQSMADANEMTEILLTPHEIQDRPEAVPIRIDGGKVEFKNVTFKYKDNTDIFSGFDLSIAAGERVALVGPSGGGKSTTVKLLFRSYDLHGGTIEIDGQDISSVTQESLRSQISLVPQDPILFHRSILENIRYANPEASVEEVIAAAKAAHCHEFIDKLPKKYETFVGERGVKLSGGERQRVAIARAILKNAPILVLDEATSSLDSESENLIQDALKSLMQGKTTIVIAHRLSTIMAMDRIVVIEDGQITEQGKHEELLKAQEGKYQKLWHIQSGSYA